MDEILRALAPVGVMAVSVPLFFWRIYKWIDVRTRAQVSEGLAAIVVLRAEIVVLQLEVGSSRAQRITEVDAERAKRILAEDDAAHQHATVTSLTEQNRGLQNRLDRDNPA